MEKGCNFRRRKEREREGLRGRKRKEREKSDLIESLNLEQPKVEYPNLSYKLVVSPSSVLAQQTCLWCAQGPLRNFDIWSKVNTESQSQH